MLLMHASRNLEWAKASIPVFSAAFVAAAIWFCHAAYSNSSSSSSQGTHRKDNEATLSSNQETYQEDQEAPPSSNQTRSYIEDHRSLRRVKGAAMKYTRVRYAQLSPRENKPGFIVKVVQCPYQMTLDSIEQGTRAILRSLDTWHYTDAAPFPIKVVMSNSPTRNVNSSYYTAWSTGNLDLLANQLDVLWRTPKGGQLCSKLTISLPDTPIAVTDGVDVLPATDKVLLPRGLRTLEWTGNREQLPMFFTNQLAFTTLTNLTLRCALSMDECKTLLWWGSGHLVNVNIKTIKAPNDTDLGQPRELLPPMPNSIQNIQMIALKSLTIESTVDIRNLYASPPQFRFPAIKKVTLDVSDPNFDILECERHLTSSGAKPKWIVRCAMNATQEEEMIYFYGDRFDRLSPRQPDFDQVQNQLRVSDFLGDPWH